MKIPKRGNIYSCNEAYSESWDENFKRYLKTIKTGTGQTGQRYTQRYIGSMVGDVSGFLQHVTVSQGFSNNNFPATFFLINAKGPSNTDLRRHILLPI